MGDFAESEEIADDAYFTFPAFPVERTNFPSLLPTGTLRARGRRRHQETLLLNTLLKFPKCSKAKNRLTNNDGRTTDTCFQPPFRERRKCGRTSDCTEDSIRWI